MTLSNLHALGHHAYLDALFEILKPSENAVLKAGSNPNGQATYLHNDGVLVPTVGYGFALGKQSADEIEAGIRFAFTGTTDGALDAKQENGLQIILDWKDGAEGAVSTQQLIDMAKGTYGTKHQIAQLHSLHFDDASATALLQYTLFEDVGQNSHAVSEAFDTLLATKSIVLPESEERAGLLDAFYNGGHGVIGPLLLKHLQHDERAGVWFELRYDSKFTDSHGTVLGGLINRRIAESNLIGASTATTLRDAKFDLNYLFNGTSSAGKITYDLVVKKDHAIVAHHGASFADTCDPLLAIVATAYDFDAKLHFLQMGKAGHSADLTAKAAADRGFDLAHSNNALFGGDLDDTLTGGGGKDLLVGGTGKDRLDGGKGDDLMIGGKGNDTYVVNTDGDRLVEAHDHGFDTVESAVSWQLGENFEALTLTGNKAINGTGNAGNNTIIGNGANNVLDGQGGVDFLSGGGGDDHLICGGTTVMTGGTGADTFVILLPLPGGTEAPLITDFTSGEDTLDMQAFAGFAWSFWAPDSDGDSVLIGGDAMADEAESFIRFTTTSLGNGHDQTNMGVFLHYTPGDLPQVAGLITGTIMPSDILFA